MNSSVINFNHLQKLSNLRLVLVPGFSETNFNSDINFADFLESLEIWSLPCSEAPNNLRNYLKKSDCLQKQDHNLLDYIKLCRQRGLIKDSLGIKKNCRFNQLIFSGLVGSGPKPYLAMYLFFAQGVKKKISLFRFIIHLEDSLPRLLSDKSYKFKPVDMYRGYIDRFRIADKVILTSTLFKQLLVPMEFTREYFANLLLDDFLSVLPFHNRQSNFILLSDILHFVWQVYFIHFYPGIYLTSINSKREFLVFRKCLSKQLPVIFFPIAPENAKSKSDINFYQKYHSLTGNKNITSLKELLNNSK